MISSAVPNESVVVQAGSDEGWLVFHNPVARLQSRVPAAVAGVPDDVAAATAAGRGATDRICSLAASGLEPSVKTRAPFPGLP
jgi:hypothetical protein